MVRKCIKIPEEIFRNVLQITVIQSIEMYIDVANSDEILTTLVSNVKKTRRILNELLNGRYNDELYGNESFSNDTKNLTAFKYKGKGKNIRIYCKEYFDEQIIPISRKLGQRKKVVLITVHHKKTKALDKKVRTLLETIAGYDYEFEE